MSTRLRKERGDFQPYPETDDPDFYQKIYHKKEFYETRSEKNPYAVLSDPVTHQRALQVSCSRDFFRLQKFQIFVRNFLSPGTPYNSLLIFAGTGTGKTCAAIQIAEGFKENVKKHGQKITIIASEDLQVNFQRDLYNPAKEAPGVLPGASQCTGSTYYLPPVAGQSPEERLKQIRALQGQYYQYATYIRFYKEYEAELPAGLSEKSFAAYIRRRYDNAVYIIDEAHNLIEGLTRTGGARRAARGGDGNGESDLEGTGTGAEGEEDEVDKITRAEVREAGMKIYRLFLEVILPLCRNVKLVMLTGTPMRNEPQDVIRLLNLQRMLDYKDPEQLIVESAPRGAVPVRGQQLLMAPAPDDMEVAIDPKDIYDADYLARMAQGYVVYVRGDNPVTYARKYYYVGTPGRGLENRFGNDRANGGRRGPEVYLARPYFNYYQQPIDMYALYLEEDQLRRPYYQALMRAGVSLPRPLQPTAAMRQQFANLIRPSRIEQICCHMSPFQYIHYLRLESRAGVSSASAVREQRVEGGNVPIPLTFACLIVFPNVLSRDPRVDWVDDQGVLHEAMPTGAIMPHNNSNNVFEREAKSLRNWSYRDTTFSNMLHGDQVGYYSAKFARLLSFVTDSTKEGIHYVYTQYKANSAFIIAIMLEQNGFMRWSGGREMARPFLNLTDRLPKGQRRCYCGRTWDEHQGGAGRGRGGRNAGVDKNSANRARLIDHNFSQAYYFLYTSNFIATETDLAKINSAANRDGQIVKVIIGTNTASEGVDYKRLRHMHIMDPWHNATVMDQTIGRALRYCAHADLPPEAQTVVVYQYTACPPDKATWDRMMAQPIWEAHMKNILAAFNGMTRFANLPIKNAMILPLRETSDERIYRRAYFKDQHIKFIERVLKSTAVDCPLNYRANLYPTDRAGSREMEYQDTPYRCRYDAPEIDEKALDTDTYEFYPYFSQPLIEELVNRVRSLYRQHLALDLPTIESLIFGVGSGTGGANGRGGKLGRVIAITPSERRYLYQAMARVIGRPPQEPPLPVYDRYGRLGQVLYRAPYYVFQPAAIRDQQVPLRYRQVAPTVAQSSRRPLEIEGADVAGNRARFSGPETVVTFLLPWLMHVKNHRLDPNYMPLLLETVDRLLPGDQKVLAEQIIMMGRDDRARFRPLIEPILAHYLEWLMLIPLQDGAGHHLWTHRFDPIISYYDADAARPQWQQSPNFLSRLAHDSVLNENLISVVRASPLFLKYWQNRERPENLLPDGAGEFYSFFDIMNEMIVLSIKNPSMKKAGHTHKTDETRDNLRFEIKGRVADQLPGPQLKAYIYRLYEVLGISLAEEHPKFDTAYGLMRYRQILESKLRLMNRHDASRFYILPVFYNPVMAGQSQRDGVKVATKIARNPYVEWVLTDKR